MFKKILLKIVLGLVTQAKVKEALLFVIDKLEPWGMKAALSTETKVDDEFVKKAFQAMRDYVNGENLPMDTILDWVKKLLS